ncbi:MAG: hypothetical protein K1V99_01155 [Bacteroidales bacterium]|nr:hypothetical protein [Bacteroidales bacterium]
MKGILKNMVVAAAILFSMLSCDIDAKFETRIPVHALVNMVKSATATIGSETVPGTVDNNEHTIVFVFNDASDFSDALVRIVYSPRTVCLEGALEEFNTDLSGAYSFVVNNQEEDFTYTVTASRAAVRQVDRAQCSVVLGLDNDADPEKINDSGNNRNASYLFDGKWMSKKAAYSEVGYRHFGWNMTSSGTPPAGPDGKQFGNAYTVDFGEPMRVAKMRFWPYYPYEGNAAALFEIYAYTLDGDPSGDWTGWQMIAEVDDSEKWQIVKNADPGSADDLCTEGTVVEFDYNAVPDARYYRVKIVKNFYAFFQTAMDQYWSGRQFWYSVSELEVWKYNLE